MCGLGALAGGLSGERLFAAVRDVLDATVAPGAGIILGLSGGPDSTALAHLVIGARPDLRAVVVHVRHGLRDDAADAKVAAAHAEALGVAFHERPVVVDAAGVGIEAAARDARYQALRAVAVAEGAVSVAVGHTADDQAETLLLNLARGSGVRGLAAMSASRPDGPVTLVRPLLAIRRSDVRAFVARRGLTAVTDPTNTDPSQRRARVRAEVLPALARLSGGAGDPVGVLTRLADLARADADALDALAEREAQRLVAGWGPVRAVRRGDLEGLPPALATRVLRRMLAEVRGGLRGLTAGCVAGMLQLRAGQALHVPGGAWVTAGGGWIAAAPPGLAGLPARALALPGVTPLPEVGLAVHADFSPGAPPVPAVAEPPPLRRAPGPGAVALPAELATGLVVRAWAPGDRLALPGWRRKLADLMTDAGAPRALRGLLPVIADATGQPLWMPWLGSRALPAGHDPAARLWVGPLSRAQY